MLLHKVNREGRLSDDNATKVRYNIKRLCKTKLTRLQTIKFSLGNKESTSQRDQIIVYWMQKGIQTYLEGIRL